MLNHRQFTCYMTNPSRIKKVGSLLKEFGLYDRQSNGTAKDMLYILKQEIDYSKFDRIAKDKIEKSKKFLAESLG